MKKSYNHQCIKNESEDYIITGVSTSGNQNMNMDYIMQAIHPDFPNVKLLVLTDGLRRAHDGQGGGIWFCKAIESEFNKLKESDFTNPRSALQDIVYCANKQLEMFNVFHDRECYAAGAVAMIMNGRVYCIAVGDVNAYYTRNGELIKLTDGNVERRFLGYNRKTIPSFLDEDVKEDVQRREVVYYAEDIDSVYLMCDGVDSHVSEECKADIMEKIDSADIPTALIEVAQYGYTISDGSTIMDNVEPSDDNLSVIGYASTGRKKIYM